MHIVQITPGAGGMFCGNCFRDNALVAELRRLGHSTDMIPLYLPMTLEDSDQSAGTPIFFSGINVYLEQKIPLLQKMPDWLHRVFESPSLLKLAAGSAAKTRPEDVGDLTISMLIGEEGNQAREIEELNTFLRSHGKADVLSLSNGLLLGMARRIKRTLSVPVVCTLQGEDSFLDSFAEPYRSQAWEIMAERAREVDLLIAPSRYYAQEMIRRLGVKAERLQIVANGIDCEGYGASGRRPSPPVLGYFARMCREKGVDTIVETFMEIRRRGRIPDLKLHVGGGMGPSDAILVGELKERLRAAGLIEEVTFFPNLDKAQKQKFLGGLSVFSVPAMYGEAFGLYLLEAWASGVPVVQPPAAAFPELIEATGGGLIAASARPEDLAAGIEELLLAPGMAAEMGAKGRQIVQERFSSKAMSAEMVAAFQSVIQSARSQDL
jgi:glycosyltransferase involved in cell wall biosynthesis